MDPFRDPQDAVGRLRAVSPQPTELDRLHEQTLPCPGRPGWRFERSTGREWYSDAWIDEAQGGAA